MGNPAAVSFFGAGTLDANPPRALVELGDPAPTPTITAIVPTTVVHAVAFTLAVIGTGFTTGHAPVQVRIGTVAKAPVNAGFTSTGLTATFPSGATPAATYSVIVDFNDGTNLTLAASLVVT